MDYWLFMWGILITMVGIFVGAMVPGRSKKYKSGAGIRVTFSATVGTPQEGQYLLDQIIKIRHPSTGAFVMYDIEYKTESS